MAMLRAVLTTILVLLVCGAMAQPRMKAVPIAEDDAVDAASNAASKEDAPPQPKAVEMMPEMPPRPMVEVLLNGYVKNTGLKNLVPVTVGTEKWVQDSPAGPGQESLEIVGKSTVTIAGPPSDYRWLRWKELDVNVHPWGGVLNKTLSFWFWTDDEMPQGLSGQSVARHEQNRLFVRTYPEDDYIAAHIAANIELSTKTQPGELFKKWVHVGVTFHSNLTRLTLYVNGRKEKTVSGIDPLVCWFSDSNFLIGNSDERAMGLAPGGRVAWIRLFDAELTKEQIMWLYEERRTGASPIPADPDAERNDSITPNATSAAPVGNETVLGNSTSDGLPTVFVATATDAPANTEPPAASAAGAGNAVVGEASTAKVEL